MRTSAICLALLLFAGSASAQSADARPDYSRDTVLRMFLEAGDEEDARAIRFRPGSIELQAFGTPVRIQPVMMFSGSGFGVTNEMPDPFALTGTEIATTPETFVTQREVTSELRRIEETERARVRVTR